MEETLEMQNNVIQNKPSNAKRFWKGAWHLSMPAIFTFVIICLAMIVRGVYPFGGQIFGYIDYAVGAVPGYTHLWDIVHGRSGLFVDWNLGGGTNGYVSFAYFLFSPIDLLICLFPRESIAFTLSFVMIIKLCLMALTSHLLFRKLFPNVNIYLSSIMSVLWALSGWTLVHFTNLGWLDIMILLPIAVYFLKKMLEEKGKAYPFILVLAWMLLLSYYITYMALLALVVCAFIYVFVVAEKSRRREISSKLFFAVIMAILLSVVVFIPSCLITLGAHRFTGEGTSALGTGYFTNFFSKLAVLLFSSLPIYLFARLSSKIKKDKIVLCFVLCLGVLLLGLIIEPINLMWHTGSYYCFPYRYSFMIVFTLILGGMYYLNNYCKPNSFLEENSSKIWKMSLFMKVFLLSISLISAIVIGIFAIFAGTSHPYRALDFHGFAVYLGVFLTGLLGLSVVLLGKNNALKRTFVIIFCILQVFPMTSAFMGSKNNLHKDYVTNTYEINTSLLDTNYRLKDKDRLYMENLAFMTTQPSLATWIHVSSENQWQTHSSLGYGTQNTMLLDAGGTYFSDMALGYKYVMTERELASSLYILLDTFENKYVETNEASENYGEEITRTVNLYEMRYTLPYVNSFNYSDEIFASFNGENPFDLNNRLYRKLFSKGTDILTKITPTINETSGDLYTITLPCSAESNLYIYMDAISEIYIDDEKCNTITNSDKGIIYDLGVFDSDVEIKVKSSKEPTIDDFALSQITKIRALSNTESQTYTLEKNGNSLNIKYTNSSGEKYLFVPITYLENYDIKVNGEKVETLKTFNGFVAFETPYGTNNITITFSPKYLKICVIISLASLLLLILLVILNKKFRLSSRKWVQYIGMTGAILICGVVAFLIYLKPMWRFVTGKF